MFPFVNKTWNPLGGKCIQMCDYCWSMGEKGLVNKFDMEKYRGEPRLYEKEFKRKFKDDDFVFLQDMSDICAYNVPYKYILRIFDHIRKFPRTKFLLLTKNPANVYFALMDVLPPNLIIGATIESNRDYPTISKAPKQSNRLNYMHQISKKANLPLFISIEPILDFGLEKFVADIKLIKPWAVAVGFDNYSHNLEEPKLDKVLKLIEELEKVGIKVYRKTLRKAWDET